jgi:predicted dehydrogenase
VGDIVLKVGIAGYGIVGKRRHDVIKHNPGMHVAAVCDRKFNGQGKLDDGVFYYDNYKALLENEALDALIICMTNDIAPEVTMAGLNSGLHVFCEKPPGRSVQDIKNVIKVEARYPKLKLMYGFNHRHHYSVKDALAVINSGEMGAIINLRGVYGKSKVVTFNQDTWRTKKEIAGGGVLLDQGIHMVDLMRLFAGEFTQVYSFISNSYWGYDVEDNAYALMKTGNGVVGMLHSSATEWRHRFSLDINLEKGSINLGGILSSTKSYGAETMTLVWANPDEDNGDPREQMTRYNKDPSWSLEIAAFADAIRSGEPILYGGSTDALQTMELVYKIYEFDNEWNDKYNLG